MPELYNSNNTFRSYVDKYCKTYHVTVREAFTHALVKEVYKYIIYHDDDLS